MVNSTDFIPRSDNEFQAWLTNFINVLKTNTAAVGLTDADIAKFVDGKADFDSAVKDQFAKQNAAKAATNIKNKRRDNMEQLSRTLAKQLNVHPKMTDDLRISLGLTVPTTSRAGQTVGNEAPAMVLEVKHGQVIVHWGSNPTNEHNNAKPKGVKGCNIYRKKSSDADFELIAYDTSSPYIDKISGSATDVFYKVAYRGTKDDEIGPMSTEQKVAVGG